MRRINLSALAIFLFALPFMVLAQEYETSLSTFTTTRTVYRVTTETATGTPPATVYNTSSTTTAILYNTIVPTYIPSGSGSYNNATGTGYVSATLSGTASVPSFTGAASNMFNKDAALAAVVAGLGLLAL